MWLKLLYTKTTVRTLNEIRKLFIILLLEPNANNDGSVNYPGPVNDIALLELAEEVDLTMYTPVCLARTGLTEAGMTLQIVKVKSTN